MAKRYRRKLVRTLDKLVIRESKTKRVTNVIFPNGLQVGLGQGDFDKNLVVKGAIAVSGKLNAIGVTIRADDAPRTDADKSLTNTGGVLYWGGVPVISSLTTEEVQDIIGGMLSDTETGITVTYDDTNAGIEFVVDDVTVAGDSGSTGITPGDTLTISGGTNCTTAMAGDTLTVNSTDTNTQLTTDQVEDIVDNLIVGGTNVTVTYDDGAGTLTFVSTDTNTQNTIDDTPVNGETDESISSNWAYDHNAGTGNSKHVPAAGSSGQFLQHDGDWGTPPDTDTTANETITLSGDASGSGTTSITVVVADDSHTHTTATVTNLAGTNSGDVTLSGTPDYITISGQAITRNKIDLAADVTGDLPVAEGGTGSSTSSGARTNLGVAIGSDVQAHHATLDAVAASTYTGDNAIATVGTITAGTWQGTAISQTYLSGQSGTNTGDDAGVETVNGAGTSAVNVPAIIPLGGTVAESVLTARGDGSYTPIGSTGAQFTPLGMEFSYQAETLSSTPPASITMDKDRIAMGMIMVVPPGGASVPSTGLQGIFSVKCEAAAGGSNSANFMHLQLCLYAANNTLSGGPTQLALITETAVAAFDIRGSTADETHYLEVTSSGTNAMTASRPLVMVVYIHTAPGAGHDLSELSWSGTLTMVNDA